VHLEHKSKGEFWARPIVQWLGFDRLRDEVPENGLENPGLGNISKLRKEREADEGYREWGKGSSESEEVGKKKAMSYESDFFKCKRPNGYPEFRHCPHPSCSPQGISLRIIRRTDKEVLDLLENVLTYFLTNLILESRIL
jgi:hypothetical protein